MHRGKKPELELVTFAFSAETSSELEACHWKHPALINFQQSELKSDWSLPKMGHHSHQVSGLQCAGKWPVHRASRSSISVSAGTTSSKNNCDFSRKSSTLASAHTGMRLLLHGYVGNGTSFVQSSLFPALGHWTTSLKAKLPQPQKCPDSLQARTVALWKTAFSS